MTLRSLSLRALLLWGFAASSFGDSPWDEPSPGWLAATKDVVFVFPAYAATLAAHEGGHALLAAVFDPEVKFELRVGRIGLLEGLVSYEDSRVPQWYRPLIAVAGSGFNRGLAEASSWSLGTGAIPYHLQPLFAEVALVGRFDFASNLTNAFIGDCLGGFPTQETSNDFHNFALLTSDGSLAGRLVVYGALFALCATDIVLDHERIGRTWTVLLGTRY